MRGEFSSHPKKNQFYFLGTYKEDPIVVGSYYTELPGACKTKRKSRRKYRYSTNTLSLPDAIYLSNQFVVSIVFPVCIHNCV